MNRYGDWQVLAQHSHGVNTMRVWVMHIPTGRKEFRIVPLPGAAA